MLLRRLKKLKNVGSIDGRTTELANPDEIMASVKKMRRVYYIGMLITMLAILPFPVTAQELSNSGGGGWQYYRNITLSNSGGVLTNYQVLINLIGSDFPDFSKSKGADIRFTDESGAELSYWIESWDYTNKKARIWVKITNIPANSDTTLIMYYDNPQALSVSNGSATFIAFDTVGLTEADPGNKVSVTSTGVSWLYLNPMNPPIGTYVYRQAPTPISDYIYDFDYMLTGGDNSHENGAHIYFAGVGDTAGSVCSQSNQIGAYLYYAPRCCGANINIVQTSSGAETKGPGRGIGISPGTRYYGRITRTETTGALALYSDTTRTSHISGSPVSINVTGASMGYILPMSQSSSSESTPCNIQDYYYGKNAGWSSGYLQNIRVRNYALPEPTVSVGAETEVVKDFTFVHLTDVHIGYKFHPWNSEMRDSVEHFTDTLQMVKNINPSFVLITGDLVENDKKDFFIAFKNLLRSISIPVYTTPGNHDRRNLVLFGDDLTDYNAYINPANNPSRPDDDNYSFTYEGYHFIGLDSGADYNAALNETLCKEFSVKCVIDYPPESDGLSDEQLTRLRGEFNNTYPKIVFMHHPVMSATDDSVGFPPVPPDGAPGGNDGAIAINRWDFINYTKESNVQLVLTGHSHYDHIFDINGHEVDNSSNNKPLFIQTENEGYRIIEVKNGKTNPYNTYPKPSFNGVTGAIYMNLTDIIYRFGLHAYDSQGRHTGMKADCSDMELGIPDSYYTGDYGGKSNTPQVIVSYSSDTNIRTVKEFRIFAPQCLAPSVSNAAMYSNAATDAQSRKISFNMTIEDQTETYTKEINFYNIYITASSIVTVNVSDGMAGYKMEVDIDGDGTTDQIINPDSIYVTPAHPQGTITVPLYNGAGLINLTTSSGSFSKAISLNESLIPGKPYFEYPFGIYSFSISGLGVGQKVNITIDLPQNLSSSARYWNYGRIIDNSSPYWYQIPLASNNGDNRIQIQLQDGGAGDEDLTANGVILSTGGPGIALPDTEMMNFATGSGWFYADSDSTLPGKKAKFEFETRYHNGKPRGNLEFQQKIADIKLKSKSIDWLAIKDGIIRFQGTGRINDGSSYSYLVTAKDNDRSEDDDKSDVGVDYFDIIIWNSTDTRSGLNLRAGNTLEGGNIAVHKNKSHESDSDD